MADAPEDRSEVSLSDALRGFILQDDEAAQLVIELTRRYAQSGEPGDPLEWAPVWLPLQLDGYKVLKRLISRILRDRPKIMAAAFNGEPGDLDIISREASGPLGQLESRLNDIVCRQTMSFFDHVKEGKLRILGYQVVVPPSLESDLTVLRKTWFDRPGVRIKAPENLLGFARPENGEINCLISEARVKWMRSALTSAAEVKAYRWLRDQAQASPDRKLQKKEHYIKEMVDLIEDLSNEAAKRAWKRVRQEFPAWGKAGRPRKKS